MQSNKESGKSVKQNMGKNVIWNTFGSIFYCVCQWLITILVVHIASYTDAGFLSIAMTTSSSFSAISLFSMRNYQVSDVNGRFSDNEYVGSRIFTCMVALAGCVIVSAFNRSIFQMLCIDAFMLVRVAEGLADVIHGVDQKFNRYDYIGISFIIRGIVTIGAFVAALYITGDLFVTLLIMALLNLVAVFLFDWIMLGKLEAIKPVIMNKKVFELLKICLPLVITYFLLNLINLIPKNILVDVADREQLGIYSSIATPTLVVQVFAQFVFNPFIPSFSKKYNDRDYSGFLSLLRKTYVALVIMSIVATIGAMLIGRIGLKILFGEDILEHYYLFMPIVWCTILLAIVWIFLAILIAMRKIKLILIGMAAVFVMFLAGAYPVVAAFEKNGVSIIQIITLAVFIVFLLVSCEITMARKIKKGKSE